MQKAKLRTRAETPRQSSCCRRRSTAAVRISAGWLLLRRTPRPRPRGWPEASPVKGPVRASAQCRRPRFLSAAACLFS